MAKPAIVVSVFNASAGSALAQWDAGASPNTTQTTTIPNFFSRSMFGNTNEIRDAAQIFVVAAIIAIVLRAFSRQRTKTAWRYDDWCVVAATVFLVVNQVLFIVIDYLGVKSFSFLDKKTDKQEQARLAQIVVGLKLSLAFEVMYLISIFLVKFSMLFLYRRFAKQTSGIKIYLLTTQIICVVTFAVCILSLFLSCVPIQQFWSLHGSNIQCSRRTLLTYTSGVSNIITNTLVLAVPVPLLLRATLTCKQKIGLVVLYIFGAFVIVASGLRFATQLLDVSVPQAIGWSQLEVSLAILLACAPMCVKLLLMPLLDVSVECKRLTRTPTLTVPRRPRKELTIETWRGGDRERGVDRGGGEEGERERDSNRGRRERKRSMVVPREMPSPEYQRLRIVRREENGLSVWEVRPVTPPANTPSGERASAAVFTL